jgi:broad specificity phosphatase PhoE
MKLLLIRHGESVGNAEGRMQGHYDTGLSELGREQSRLLAARLRREGCQLAALVASPLRRAAETAGVLSAALDVPVTWDERLQEYDIGLLTGVVWADVEKLYPDIWQQLHDASAPVAYPGE